MFKLFVKKYLSIIFLVATFMGVFHHHDDFQQHSDCQMCIIQASIANADTPSDVLYISKLELLSEVTKGNLPQFFLKEHNAPLRARSPPIFL